MTTGSATTNPYRVGTYRFISDDTFFVTWALIEEDGMVTLIRCNTGCDNARILGHY